MDGNPNRFYLRVTGESERDYYNLLAGMLRCRYAGNPDFADLYPSVRYWFVEVESGRVVREVGFVDLIGATDNAIPVVLGPWGRNPGLWTTLELRYSQRDGTEVGPAEFETAWDKLASQLRESSVTKQTPPHIFFPQM